MVSTSQKLFCMLITTSLEPSPGPRACIGKLIALQEMRCVLAVLVRRFDIRLADNYKAETWIEQLEDHFMWKHGPLWSVVTERQR
jgi:hypothetical protein